MGKRALLLPSNGRENEPRVKAMRSMDSRDSSLCSSSLVSPHTSRAASMDVDEGRSDEHMSSHATLPALDLPVDQMSFGGHGVALQTAALNGIRTCQRCLATFSFSQQFSQQGACVFHPGSYSGFERGKLYGGRTSDFGHLGPRVVYMWECCSQTDPDAAGCARQQHVPYD